MSEFIFLFQFIIASTFNNNNDCNLYISIGGNNILNMLNTNVDVDKKQLNKIFEKYKELIGKIKNQYSNANIYIFNLYFTSNKKHKPIVEEWNKLVNSFCLKNEYTLLLFVICCLFFGEISFIPLPVGINRR